MPWIPPLLQEDEYARRRSSSAARSASRPGATSPTVGGAKRPRPTPASDLRVAMKEARLQRLLQVREAGKELAASIRKDYKEKKEAGRDRVLSEARESWEEKLQEQLATLTARLQHTARVIGAGHRQASAQKVRAKAQQEAKVWQDRQHRQQEHRRSASAAQARRQQLAEVHRPEVEAAEKEQVRRELGRKTRQEAQIKAQERAAKLEAAEEEAKALADLRADPRTFLAIHTGQDVIERGEGGFELYKTQHVAQVVRHGVPVGVPEADASAFVGVRNEAGQARKQAAATREEKEAELQRRADRQKEREERAAKVQQSFKMVQSMEDDLGALAALDRRRKQHKSNVLARSVLAHQMANAKHRTTRLRAEEDLEATLLACAPFVAPTAPQALHPAPRRVSLMGGVENEDPAAAPLPPPSTSVMIRLPPPPPPPPEDEFTWELGGAAAAGAPRLGAEALERQREEEDEEEEKEERDAEATQRMWSELERLKDKVATMEGRQHEHKEEPTRSRRLDYRPLEGFPDQDYEEVEEDQPAAPEDEEQGGAAPPAPSPPTRTDWGVSKEVVSQVLKGLVGEATVQREARTVAQATLPVVREEREGVDEEDERGPQARGRGARLGHSAATEEEVEEEEDGDVAIADELLARAEQDLVNAGATVPRPDERHASQGEGEGGGRRAALQGLRERGLAFDPKLEELEDQRRQLAQVRAITRSLEASSATESGSGASQPPPVPPSSLRPVPKPPALPPTRQPNDSTAPLTLLSTHTDRPINEGTIEDLRAQLGGAASQGPRQATANRGDIWSRPEGAGGEREPAGAGLGAEGFRTRATGELSKRAGEEGQGGQGKEEGAAGRGAAEGSRSRPSHKADKEDRREEGYPGSTGRDGASAAMGPLSAEEPPHTPRLSIPLLARLRDTEASMTPSSDVLSDLTVAGDSLQGQPPPVTFTEGHSFAPLPRGGGGVALSRSVHDEDEGCSTPSSLSHPQGLHLLDQGLSDDEGTGGLECYSLDDMASSSSPPPAPLTRPPLPAPPTYPAPVAMRHRQSRGEVVLVSSAEHGVEISLSDHTLSSGEARQRASFLSSAAPASAPHRSYPEEEEEEEEEAAARSLPSPSAPSPPPPRDTEPRDYFTEQDLPHFSEGPAGFTGDLPEPQVPAPSAPPPPEEDEGSVSVSMQSSTSDLLYTLQHLHGEEIDVLGGSGGAEYGGAASAYPPFHQPHYTEEAPLSGYDRPSEEGVRYGDMDMAPQWQEDEQVGGWARGDEEEEDEEEEAGVGAGRRAASVFDIPLTDQAGHDPDQQPKSLQEQFLERRRRLAQRLEQRRKSREDSAPERQGDGRADKKQPRGSSTQRTARGSALERRASGGGGGGVSDDPVAPPSRLVEGRRSPVDMREARDRTARAYANLPEVRRRRDEEERLRVRLERAKKAADMKKFKPQR